ncbi:hypothetical protein Fcan01_25697 [Folsomia candida]|uniref:O-acyltransferase WSD1 C-terminal domain-containing protein n=1 Tax=Folsomia candida TaxID=158441 RepID=A0A226D310_FOLCA|nr:hypothetical protein Fcan01_25697 [Folsomia candida]
MPPSDGKIEPRLVRISDQFRHISTFIVGMAAIQRGIALISGSLQRNFNLPHIGTLLLSNISSFKENRWKLFGNPVERISPITGLYQKFCSIFILTVSYNGKIGIAITANKALFSGADELKRVTM